MSDPDREYFRQLEEKHTHPPALAPHLCPVCRGRGNVPESFYKEGGYGDDAERSIYYPSGKQKSERLDCKSCKGNGIIYEIA